MDWQAAPWIIGWIIASGLFSLIVYFWASFTRLPEETVDEYVREVYPPAVSEH